MHSHYSIAIACLLFLTALWALSNGDWPAVLIFGALTIVVLEDLIGV